MSNPFLSFTTLGLFIIAGGLVWILIRTLAGKEVSRRTIFLFMGGSLSIAIIFALTFNESPSAMVKTIYDRIEALPVGSRILLSCDYDPAMVPEVNPMAVAVTQHALSHGVKIVYMTVWATGTSMIAGLETNVIKTQFPEKQYGVDYLNCGYRAGNEAVLRVIATDFRKTFAFDVSNTPLDSFAIFEGIKTCADFPLIISIGGGKPGIKEWVKFVAVPTGAKIAGGAAAVSSPELYPYYPEQLVGLMGGTKGAAEYETLVREQYPNIKLSEAKALKMMGPQTVAHIVVLAFIIMGNVSFFRSRKKRGA